ncbi:hypothetical protein BJ741DRAFT_631565 [Chytriomyces cf. hyalinus JEL632]|nr:hypothetical protein BJ741DRAFT_631565 [Chytriomyces cf. hyalinus JEL632]
MELIAADKRNNMDRFILPKGMSKSEAFARNKLAHTANLILKQVEDNPFLKQSQFTLHALDASEVQVLKGLPYIMKYYPKLPHAPDDIFHYLRPVHDAKYMYMFNQNSWRGPPLEPERVKKVTAFMERHITMELHQTLLAEFGFPDHETYWGCLSQKSQQFIKDLASSEWTCIYAGNLFVSEQDAVADFLKVERKPPAPTFRKDQLRRSDLQSSKRVKRRSEMKRECSACK